MNQNHGQVVNISLAVEVVKWCDELCIEWRLVNDCRTHLDKVKAQSYIDKYEMKLCEASIGCEKALQSVTALIEVAHDPRVNGGGGVMAVVTLLDLVLQASHIARSEGWQCPDLLDAVSRDVVTFSKEMGIESRIAPTAWAPASSKSGHRTIGTKTYKTTTKPNVRTARGTGVPTRRRVRPDHRVEYDGEKNTELTVGNRNRGSRGSRGSRGGRGSRGSRGGRGSRGSRGSQGTTRKGRGGNSGGCSSSKEQPDLTVSSSNYDMKQNPFAVTGTGRRR